MLENDALKKYLDKASGIRYADIRTLGKNCVRAALRNNSFEVSEFNDSIIGCRALDRGYGISSTNKTDTDIIETVVEQALGHAMSINSSVTLKQVSPENGSYEHPVRKKPTIDDAKSLMMYVTDAVRNELHSITKRIEIVLSYTEFNSGLVTSEGTDVKEAFSTTDLKISLTIRTPSGMVEVKKVAGGKGGMEAIQHKDFESMISDLVIMTRSSAGAKRFSPFESGKKFRVILDSEAAGALARLIAHMLGADEFKSRIFDSLNITEELEIVDDPLVPNAYGSFVWDDEGVRGRKKVLVSNGIVNLLHTRLTAQEKGIPGNAHGISSVPKPSMSNVYINTSDWHLDEIIGDAKQGIYMKGVRRATANSSTGIIELEPVIAFRITQKEIKESVSNVKVIDSVQNILEKIDAIGKLVSLIPSIEEGFNTSVGAPYLRIDGARCVYSAIQ